MRYMRVNGANTVQAHYQIVAPANIAQPPTGSRSRARRSFCDLNPSGGAAP